MVPMNDSEAPAGMQNPKRFSQQCARLLNVQNIKKQNEADRMWGATTTLDNEISLLDNNVPQTRLRGPKCGCFHHEWLDIQRKDGACGSLCGGNRECAITAAKFDDVAARPAAAERLQDPDGIEIGLPLLSRGHTAVSTFCQVRSFPYCRRFIDCTRNHGMARM